MTLTRTQAKIVKTIQHLHRHCDLTRKNLRKYPTKEKLLHEIIRRRKAGLPLNAGELAHGINGDGPLYPRGIEFFGSWRKALEAAGIRYKDVISKPRYPTAGDVIEEIQRRQKAGLPIRSKEMQRGSQRDSTLYHTAQRYFGQWYRAVEKAGVSHHEVSPRWSTYQTPRSVLAEIRRRHRAGLPLNYNAVAKGISHDTALCGNDRAQLFEPVGELV